MNDTSANQPKLIDIAKIEFMHLLEQAKEYKEKINTAKTRAKRDLYQKKLKKNNIEAMQMLVAIEKLEAREAEKSGSGNNTEDVISTGQDS